MTPFLGQLMLFPFNFAPKGWALCNGALLQISQNQALFSLLGTTFGGDGRATFGLPDLRGRVALGTGTGVALGAQLGEEMHTLQIGEVPPHNHLSAATTSPAAATPPRLTGLLLGASNPSEYVNATPGNAMAAGVIAQAGGSAPHENRQPYLVLSWCIALDGIFPSRN
jgi:microcystin-dependent protein